MFAALSVFATGLEVAQLWIPGRWFDWKDIVASVGGLAIAWAIVAAARCIVRRGGRSRGQGAGYKTQASAVFTGVNGESGGIARERVLEDVAV